MMNLLHVLLSILMIIVLMPLNSGIPKNILLETFISNNNVRYIRIMVTLLICIFYVKQFIHYATRSHVEAYSPPKSIHNELSKEDNKDANIFATEYLEKQAKHDASVQQFAVKTNLLEGSPVWKETGSFPYSGTGYVPDYEESVYLSDQFKSKPEHLTTTPYLNGGFCSALGSTPLQMEDKCNSLERDICASTDCCVLLGGQKCVKGNESGPHFKNNYSNFLIKNKDYYYYQGKCFGNCPE